MKPDFYKTQTWLSLDLLSRAELLLVIERLKPGSFTGGDWSNFPAILNEAGLEGSLNTPMLALNPVFAVGTPEMLNKYFSSLIKMPRKVTLGDYHRASGDFLGYPACCIEEYSRKRTPEEKNAKKDFKRRHESYTFGRELSALIAETESYPVEFDYSPPAFTPCSVTCKPALSMLASYKDALLELDEEASCELLAFNRASIPNRLAHEEWFFEKQKNERKERISRYWQNQAGSV